MADKELVIKIDGELYKDIYSDAEIMIYGGMRSGKTLLATLLRAIRNGTPLTPDTLADLLMNERIRGELKQDISYSKDVIDDVKCRLTVDIIDRRPCYCGAELREVWRESEDMEND